MTLTEFKQWMKAYRMYELTDSEFLEKVEAYSSASNGSKPLVSGSLPVDEIIEQLGEKRNRYEIWHDGGEWIISRFQKDDCRTVIGWLTGNDR